MKRESEKSSGTRSHAIASPRQKAQHLKHGGDTSVVTLEDGEPCLESPPDGGQWDWDTEAVSSIVRCQECGNSERIFKEPDGRILCETCLLRGCAQDLPASV
jgi:hypothetical protein